MDYLKNRAKSGDMAVFELIFRNVSLGKWSKIELKIDPATVSTVQLPFLQLVEISVRVGRT